MDQYPNWQITLNTRIQNKLAVLNSQLYQVTNYKHITLCNINAKHLLFLIYQRTFNLTLHTICKIFIFNNIKFILNWTSLLKRNCVLHFIFIVLRFVHLYLKYAYFYIYFIVIELFIGWNDHVYLISKHWSGIGDGIQPRMFPYTEIFLETLQECFPDTKFIWKGDFFCYIMFFLIWRNILYVGDILLMINTREAYLVIYILNFLKFRGKFPETSLEPGTPSRLIEKAETT